MENINYNIENSINKGKFDVEKNIRNKNNLLSEENKYLKNMNQKLENQIIIKENNLDDIDIILRPKHNLKSMMNQNSILVYKILNYVNDIYSLNNNVRKLTSNYDGIKLNKLIFDNQFLKYQKEKAEIKKKENQDEYNNLNTLYNSAKQKNINYKEISVKYEKIIENYNFRNNYINDMKEANIKIDFLLNQKQKLIEDNINLINFINNVPDKNNKKEEYEIHLKNSNINKLKNKNRDLKDKLNKYNSIIKNLNLSLNNISNKSNIDDKLDKQISQANQYKDNIKNQIEFTINNYKKEINKREKIINKLKNKFIAVKKNELTSLDNLIYI